MNLLLMNTYLAILHAQPAKVHLIQVATFINIYILKCEYCQSSFENLEDQAPFYHLELGLLTLVQKVVI